MLLKTNVDRQPAAPIRRPSSAGFSLLELLISTALTSVALGVLYSSLIGFQKMHFDQTARIDVEQGLKASFEIMVRDLESAGFGLINNGKLGNFGTVFPNSDTTDTATTDAITLWTDPNTAQSVLPANMANKDDPVRVTSVAGFAVGMRVWVMGFCTDDTINRDLFEITAIDATPPMRLHHDTPENASKNLSCKYKGGAKVIRMKQINYAITAPVDGLSDLTRTEDEGQPVVLIRGVTNFDVAYFDNTGTAITPNNSTLRRAIRRMRITLAGKSLELMRGSGISPNVVSSVVIAPRNLVLQEIL